MALTIPCAETVVVLLIAPEIVINVLPVMNIVRDERAAPVGNPYTVHETHARGNIRVGLTLF